MVRRLTEEDLAEPKHPAARELVARGERIAYFSAEFGLTEVLPIYAGGLGVLAGDHLKSASDLGVPARRRGDLLPRGLLPPGRRRRRHAERGLSDPRAGRSAALDRRDPGRQPADRDGRPRRTDRPPARAHGEGRPRAAPAPRLEPSGERAARPRDHGAAVRRRPRDAPAAGDRARDRGLPRPREGRRLADDPPHQRGPRRLRLAREDPAPRPGGAPLLRRGAGGRDDRQHRSRRTRPCRRASTCSRRSCSGSTSEATSTSSASRSTSSSTSAARSGRRRGSSSRWRSWPCGSRRTRTPSRASTPASRADSGAGSCPTCRSPRSRSGRSPTASTARRGPRRRLLRAACSSGRRTWTARSSGAPTRSSARAWWRRAGRSSPRRSGASEPARRRSRRRPGRSTRAP